MEPAIAPLAPVAAKFYSCTPRVCLQCCFRCNYLVFRLDGILCQLPDHVPVPVPFPMGLCEICGQFRPVHNLQTVVIQPGEWQRMGPGVQGAPFQHFAPN